MILGAPVTFNIKQEWLLKLRWKRKGVENERVQRIFERTNMPR